MGAVEFFPDPDDWPAYTFGYPYEAIVAYGPDGLAKALEWLGAGGYKALVGTDNGFSHSNRVERVESVRRAMLRRGLDPDLYACVRSRSLV